MMEADKVRKVGQYLPDYIEQRSRKLLASSSWIIHLEISPLIENESWIPCTCKPASWNQSTPSRLAVSVPPQGTVQHCTCLPTYADVKLKSWVTRFGKLLHEHTTCSSFPAVFILPCFDEWLCRRLSEGNGSSIMMGHSTSLLWSYSKKYASGPINLAVP
jgi:hypothetical protein